MEIPKTTLTSDIYSCSNELIRVEIDFSTSFQEFLCLAIQGRPHVRTASLKLLAFARSCLLVAPATPHGEGEDRFRGTHKIMPIDEMAWCVQSMQVHLCVLGTCAIIFSVPRPIRCIRAHHGPDSRCVFCTVGFVCLAYMHRSSTEDFSQLYTLGTLFFLCSGT